VQIETIIAIDEMIEILLVSVLLLLTLLFLAHHKWENSVYVRTIDLIPGPKRKFISGNVSALPKDAVGKIKMCFHVG
jgi:hypothetical protein